MIDPWTNTSEICMEKLVVSILLLFLEDMDPNRLRILPVALGSTTQYFEVRPQQDQIHGGHLDCIDARDGQGRN